MRGSKAVREGQRLLQLVGSAEGAQLADRLLSSSLAGSSGKSALHHSDPFTSFRAVVRAYSNLVRRQGANIAQQSVPASPQQRVAEAQVIQHHKVQQLLSCKTLQVPSM